MKLVKTTFFSAIITFIRIASGFVAGKAIAIFTGPMGVALIGAFNNLTNILLTFANGAINAGVVKYTAEYVNDEERLKALFSTAFKISVYCSAIIGLILLVFGSTLSDWLFTSELYTNPVRVLGLTIVLYSLNSLLISILNGKGQIRTYTIVNAIGNIVGLIFTLILIFFYKIEGALYALVLAQSIVFFFTAALITKSPWFSIEYFKQAFDKSIAVKLSHYSLMAIVSALTVPISQIILRNMLIGKIGIDAAGYWQAMMRISDGYLMLITTALTTYYLPKLSALKTDAEIRVEIFNGYRIILPAVFTGCCAIYFLRFFLIKTLYTNEFIQMESLFFWQLVGDFFKMASWILAFLMLAKSLTRVYVVTEIVFSISYVLIAYSFVDSHQLQGITIAFSINYFIYFITMVVIFRKIIWNLNYK
ncbi:MAG: O-antigen translocase [Ferruginibacter sp.]